MGERYPDTVEVGGSIPPAPTKTILFNGGTIGIRRSKLPTRSDDTARVNDQINVPEVRVIDGEGGQLGIMSIEEALEQSEEAGMDLVEVSPKANPPVCRMHPANRRIGFRRNFNQVHSCFFRLFECLFNAHDAKLSPFSVNHTHFRNINLIINPCGVI